ncbi:MAG: queuosine precursor transporter [Cytophagaceae bacterium]|nr:queuosine precursor transporter [Cytophagaceae bacterium]
MNFTKKQILFVVLCGIFLTNAIIVEIIGGKIFSLESVFGLPPAGIKIFGNTLDFNMTAGALNWPIVFIISDIINEYFGVKGVKYISYLTAILIVYAFFVLYAASGLPPAAFWLDINKLDNHGLPLNINNAYSMILRQGMGIIVGSIVAFLIGQMVDALVFSKLRKITSNKMIWLRATGSTLVSQLIDSFVVLFIAFYVFGKWDFTQVMAVSSVNYIYKFGMAILLTPLIYVIHYIIDRYLGDAESHEMIEKATFS